MVATVTPTRVSRVARVVRNERVTGGCHVVEAEIRQDGPDGPQGPWPDARAGQFCMLSLDDPRFPLLPRPFSLLGSTPAEGPGRPARIEFMIMPIGRGSGMLCSVAPGDALNVVGPLGHALDDGLPPLGDRGGLVCVAGGYGVAPFLFLMEQWRRAGDPRADRTTVIFGARTAERLSLADRLADSGKVTLCTDDGSAGLHGRVDAALRGALAESSTAMVLTCGPEPMMEAVGVVCREAGVPARASLETYMGCGYAVCNGCAVAVDDASQPDGYTYQLACREGTLFDEERLHWNLL